MRIPVFHDDQHGTAIIVGAAVTNALELAGKKLADVKIVASGAVPPRSPASIFWSRSARKRENIWVSDIEGVVYEGRDTLMDRWKARLCAEDRQAQARRRHRRRRYLPRPVGAGVLKPEMVRQMGDKPLVMALANPTPEIMPDEARAARPDAMICTGRSDFPNQVNNVLCFPFIFRGALDVGATAINEEMKLAAVAAIAQLAREAPSDVAARAFMAARRRVSGRAR